MIDDQQQQAKKKKKKKKKFINLKDQLYVYVMINMHQL